MLTGTTVFAGDLLSVRRVVCTPARTDAGAIEDSSADTVVLPVRGAFTQHLGRHRHVPADPTRALFFVAGRPYRISHPSVASDECLVLEFGHEPLRDVLRGHAGAEGLGDRRLGPAAVLPLPALALRALLARWLEAAPADALAVEELALGMLAAAAGAARRPGRSCDGDPPGRASTRTRRRELAEAIRLAVLAAPGSPQSLRQLGRQVHAGPYHAARVFRDELGVSIHQYRLRVRLAAAADLLLNGSEGVTRIALELGFSSHSHFAAAFRRMTGLTPRQLRKARLGRLDEVRTILTETGQRRS